MPIGTEMGISALQRLLQKFECRIIHGRVCCQEIKLSIYSSYANQISKIRLAASDLS